jgi:peptide/nickel transport system permease protein
MTRHETLAPKVAPAGSSIFRPAEPKPNLSQWQLIVRRFRRHRLAVIGLNLLALLYLAALFAEFVAPYPQEHRDLDAAYQPPQALRLNWEHGLHSAQLVQFVDPMSLKKEYVRAELPPIPLGFFVRGEPVSLWGIITIERRLFGVDTRRLRASPDHDAHPAFYLLGADKYGRDLFSRIIYGSRVSLSIGLVSITITFLLGVAIGGLSGYAGGSVDNLIQRLIEIISAFPQLPLWLALAAIVPSDWSVIQTYFAITIVLSLLNWTQLARVVRGKILTLRDEDYAVAARLIGASHTRVLFFHLLPGFTSHIIVSLTLSVPVMILGETALSFLGLGLRPPAVSWGVLIQECISLQVMANYPWYLLPVAFLIATVMAFNFVGDGLRDAADPYAS